MTKTPEQHSRLEIGTITVPAFREWYTQLVEAVEAPVEDEQKYKNYWHK